MRSAAGSPFHLERQFKHAHRTRPAFGIILTILFAGRCVAGTKAFAQNLEPGNQSNSIHGTVVNAITRAPIGRALVYSTDKRYATLADSEGHFEFNLPTQETRNGGGPSSVDTNWFMARKPGFLDQPHWSKATKGLRGSEVTIPLMPEALIRGQVTLPSSDPVRGIDVQLYARETRDGASRWKQSGTVRTNSNGEFRFAELGPGSYKLLTREWMDNDPETMVPGGQLYGYPPVYFPGASDFTSASTIQLTAGQTSQADLSLIRQPYYAVKIPVANTEQNGAVTITVSPQSQHGPGYSLGYNRGRHVVEGELPNGKYLVEAESFGPNSASASMNLTVAGAPAEAAALVLARNNSITVNVKEEFTSTNWQASGTMSVGGRTFAMPKLRLDLDLRVEAAEQDFGQQRGGSLRQPAGPNDDTLVLENLSPGRYWLRPHAHRGYIASATMGEMDLLHEPLVVVPGANSSIDITMRDDSAELEGTLLDLPATAPGSDRQSSRGVIDCIPLPDSSGQFLEIQASSEGKFDYRMVAPGVYRVMAFASEQNDLPYRDAEAMKAYETEGQIVHFAPGQKVTLQWQVTSGSE